LAADSTTKLGQHPAVRAFHSAAANAGLSPAAFALAHVKALPWADEIVVGVTSAAELEALFEAWENVEPALAPPDLACFDLSVIDPRRWAA
jgi:aryl-alcohol dehydrogenase-like predicted oxidoreductase